MVVFVLDLSQECYEVLKTWSMLSFLSLQETSRLPPVCAKSRSSPDLFPLVASYHIFLRNQVHNFQTVHMLLSDLPVGRCKNNYSGMPEAEMQQVSSRLMTSSWQAGQINQSPWRQWERPDPVTHPTHLSLWAQTLLSTGWGRTPHLTAALSSWVTLQMPLSLHDFLCQVPCTAHWEHPSQPWVWPAELPPLQLDFLGSLCLDSDSSQCVPSTFLSLEISQRSIFLQALKGWKTLC